MASERHGEKFSDTFGPELVDDLEQEIRASKDVAATAATIEHKLGQVANTTCGFRLERDPAVIEMEEAILKGVDLRSKIGLRFARAEAGGRNPEYKEFKSNKARKDFRVKWVQAELDKVVEQRTHSNVLQKIDSKHGRYLSLSRIAVEEGGDADALVAAVRLAAKCALLGGVWVHWDKMGERLKFLYVELQYNEVFSRSWGLYETSHQEGTRVKETSCDASVAAGASPTKVASSTGTAKDPVEPPSTLKGKRCNDNEDETTNTTPHKKQKSAIDESFANSIKMKSEYLATWSAATQVTLQMAMDSAAWAWASSAARGKLDDAMKAISSASTPFFIDITTSKPRELKKKYSDDDLQAACIEFTRTFSPLVATLRKESSILWCMHKQRQRCLKQH